MKNTNRTPKLDDPVIRYDYAKHDYYEEPTTKIGDDNFEKFHRGYFVLITEGYVVAVDFNPRKIDDQWVWIECHPKKSDNE